MKTGRLGVVSFIRFQLGQLRAKNGHHEFEHLCRHFARATICARLLPATGPVQSGGDQGRDFESFVGRADSLAAYTDIDDPTLPLQVAGFVGLNETKRLVFTCTLQADGLEAKIRADVKAILAVGSPVDGIHAFVETDLAVARRHSLQDWARSLGVDLTIHDGQAIAEGVATPEQFWIAAELLNVPSDLWPTCRDLEYSAQKERWLREGRAISVLHFQETRELARFCCYQVEFRPELPFWHRALREVMECHPLESIRQRAAYELVMTTAHARAWDLTGVEDAVAHVLAPVDHLCDYGSLTDAMNVLAAAHLWRDGYCVPEEVGSTLDAAHARVVERIVKAIEWESATGVLALRELLVYVSDRFRSPDAVVDELIDILEASKSHPLFPLGCAKIRIDHHVTTLAKASQFDRLTALLDDAVAQRSGYAAAAESRRLRAHALHDSGDSLNAIRQLQRAKQAWYGSGQIEETVACLGDLADWYLELRLPLAAKYNAQTACGLLLAPSGRYAVGELGDCLRRMLVCDFMQGAWLKVADMVVPAIGARLSTSPDTGDPWHSISDLAAILGIVLVGARLWNPELEARMRNVLFTQLGLPPQLDPTANWTIANWSDLLRDSELEDLLPSPFSDAKNQRTLEWLGMGVLWRLSYENHEETDRVGEQIGAALQLTMAEADARTLEVVCLDVSISLQLSSSAEDVMMTPAESQSGRLDARYVLTWPNTPPDHRAFLCNLMLATAMVLSTVSMLPIDELKVVLKKLFEAEWWHTVIFARTMPDLDAELNPRTVWAHRADGTGPDERSIDPERRVLSWPSGVSARYKADEAETLLRRRYDAGLQSTRLTLPRLLQRDDFIATVNGIRNDGYLDWQILLAVSVLAANKRYCMTDRLADEDSATMAELVNHWVTSPEEEDWPAVALSEFSEQNLRAVLDCNMAATVLAHDLIPPRGYPNVALKRYLGERFKYFDDDIEHVDPFHVPDGA